LARITVVAFLLGIGLALVWFEPVPVLAFREQVWDRLVTLAPRAHDPGLGVRIVDIDDRSLEAHGQWPWPRTRIARLVTTLAELGVRAVVFDVIFAEPDRTSLSEVFKNLRADLPDYAPPMDPAAIAAQPDNDGILAAAMAGLPVVLGLSVSKSGHGAADVDRPLENLPRVRFERRKDQRYLPHHDGAVSSLPRLQQAAAANGAVDMIADPDGVTRRLPLLFKIAGRWAPALAVATVAALDGGSITARTRKPGLAGLTVGDREIPTDRYGRMRLFDSGSVPARYVSATDVLTGGIEAGALTGAIAIVGTGAEGLGDLRLTPVEGWGPGMETHAQVIEQILSGRFLSRPDWAGLAESMALLISGLLVLTAAWFNWQRVPPWSIALIAVAGLVAFSWFAFAGYALLFEPVLPVAALIVAVTYERVMLVFDLRKERSVVRNAFSRYLAPAMVKQLAADPDRLRLGGETRTMSFLFCDVRGFTAISETFGKDPVGLTRLINRFLTPMTDIIMANGGTIDKYMGDCIMAFWNAPLDDPDHIDHARRSALAMIDALAALNRDLAAEAAKDGRSPITLAIGIGLNSGPCVVGNMGSEKRFDYSVLGDPVNVASRLEGQSKTYGLTILMGESMAKEADEYATLELDIIAVKGRTGGERVFGLMGDSELGNSADFQALREGHSKMLAAYRAQDWATAQKLIGECRVAARPEWRLETLFDLYEKRIDYFNDNPPPADWDGVFVAETK
jgi:adenylate cyclase